MAFAVFIHRADSPYADSPASHYQFPPQYLSRVQPTVGDWIVYLEPSKVRDTRGYYAIAKVQQVSGSDSPWLRGQMNAVAAGAYNPLTSEGTVLSGSGTPESVVTAPVGTLFLRTDGSTSTTLYVKTSGSGNTGWTAK